MLTRWGTPGSARGCGRAWARRRVCGTARPYAFREIVRFSASVRIVAVQLHRFGAARRGRKAAKARFRGVARSVQGVTAAAKFCEATSASPPMYRDPENRFVG